jgi:hypothetical protein
VSRQVAQLGALRSLGIDRAVGLGVLRQAWLVGAGGVTIVVIAQSLSPARQGYFYTFRSLIAIQSYFELGMSAVLGTFFGHEFTVLRWGHGGEILGPESCRLRCLDFLVRATRWYLAVATAFGLVILPTGLVFLQRHGGATADFSSTASWLFTVAIATLFLSLTPLLAILLGSGSVKALNALGLLGAVLGSLFTWAWLITGHGMLAVAGSNLGLCVAILGYFCWRKPRLLRTLSRALWRRPSLPAGVQAILWKGEVWPMQWRIAVTWMSWYLVFQLLTPLLFRYRGAVVAGEMGMTLGVINALAALGFVWVNVKNPVMAQMVAERRWPELDRVFWVMLLRSTGVVIAGALGILCCLVGLDQVGSPIAHRMLPPLETALLLAAIATTTAVNAFACYLRAHKREPLMPVAASSAIVQAALVWFCAVHYGVRALTLAYLLVCVGYLLPATIWVWQRCRHSWHAGQPLAAVSS